MKSPQKILLPAAGFIIIAASGLVITHVSAATNQNSNNSESLAQRLADKFHLNKADVQSTIDQFKKDKIQKQEQNYEDRLNQAITDGKITATQKTKILDEHNKLKSELETAKNNNADPKTTFENVKKEATQWAKDNNIDVMWLLPLGPGGHHGPGHMGMMDPDSDQDTTPSQN